MTPRGSIQKGRVVPVLAFLVATAASALAQPTIASLQSALNGGQPTLPAALTTGVPLANGFTLYINGSFTPANFLDVKWVNTVTMQSQTFAAGGGIIGLSSTVIQVQIPPNLFTPAVSSPQQVNITVDETGGSATAIYTLNPLPTPPPNPAFAAGAPGTILLPGTLGIAYSQPLAQGGTAPFTVQFVGGSIPGGLSVAANTDLLAGTPTQLGPFSWTVLLTDAWGASVSVAEGTEIVDTPAIGSISPISAPAGSPALNLAVIGKNFVPAATLQQGQIPGSAVSFGGTPLSASFGSATQLTAAIPTNLLATPGSLNVTVNQPSGAASNAATFNVLGPVINSFSPPAITARSTPVTLTVNGANFTANTALFPTLSTILFSDIFVNTAIVNSSTLTTTQVFSTPGVIQVLVENPGASFSNLVNFSVLPTPAISSLSPASSAAGGASFLLTVNGQNFSPSTQIVFGGLPLATSFVNAATLTATVPGASISAGRSIPVTVINPDGYTPGALPFSVLAPLQITTTSLPAGAFQQQYSAQVNATGGVPPYVWSASLPQGLAINRATGLITGVINSSTSFSATVTAADATGVAASATFTVTVAPPPPQITTPNALPGGTVGVAYSAAFTAAGGNGSYSFSVTGGALPAGLTLSSGGVITGTPTSAGAFSFTVQVSDSTGASGTAGFSIVVKAAPLSVTGPANIPNVIVGSPVSLQFGASGGVPPYGFNYSGNLPPGTNFSRTASLTGTATSVGVFTFTVYAFDAQQTQASKSFTVTVTIPQLTITGTLGNGQAGVAYSGSIAATSGQPPYTLTVSGLPPGLTYANGAVTGTPSSPGSFTVTVSATDAEGVQGSQTFTIVIAPAALTITTAALPNGTVGTSYSGALSASGGTAPYTFSFTGLPAALTGAASGAISGAPTTPGPFTVTVTVTDSKGATMTRTYAVTIAPPLTLSGTLGSATVGTAVTTTFTASGGTPPYKWTASGLPAGLSLSPSGVLSGTPLTTGPASFSITVVDSAGVSASQTITVTIGLPAPSALSLTGLPATSKPATQSTVQVGIASSYPVDLTVTLTLTFAPDSGPDDPMVQLSTGGRVATLIIPAGSLFSPSTVGVQTGTVAGTATITARLTAASQDITPSPAPTSKVRINAAAPSISSVTAAINGSGFTVTVIGYATTRSVTSAVFTFSPATGANLQTTSVTIPVDQIFSAWYSNSASAAYGSQFTFTQPFNVQGGVSAIASVSVTLSNATGTSTPASAVLH